MSQSAHRPWLLVGACALSCNVGSSDGWSIEVKPPATAFTPTFGTKAVLVHVESSQPPVARCTSAPTTLIAPLADGTLFCPPGGAVEWIAIHGHETDNQSSCDCGRDKPPPPPGAFLRITKVETVETWSRSAALEIPVTLAMGSTKASLRFAVRSSTTYRVDVQGDLHATAKYALGTQEDAGHTATWTLEVTRPDAGPERTTTIAVKATAYGPCSDAPCAAPAGEVITLDRHAPQ